jgi:4,5-dihydroxyphthalate decarboxylase
MEKLTISIALERYDRHAPFFIGTVKAPENVDLKPLEVGMVVPGRDGLDRHGRMLRGEFDVAEMSLGSYVMAKSRGTPYTATPVFPRRLFSQNHIFVNVASGIEKPADLAGKRVAIRAFQVTMSVLAKGDLKFEYGVPWEDVVWCTQNPEEVPWTPAKAVRIEPMPKGADAGKMLIAGEVDALIHPHPPHGLFDTSDRVRRLFPDTKAECIRYFRKYGFYPIMHVMAIKGDLAEREPWLARAVMEMWEDAKAQTRLAYTDPGYSMLPFARHEIEAQENALSADPWPSGLAANRKDLERFVMYCRDQTLIDRPLAVEELFHKSVLDS